MGTGGFSQTSINMLADTAATCETVKQIIDVAITAEALAVTALGGAIASAEAGDLALSAEEIEVLRASRFVEQIHFETLAGAGATPLTTTFTLPDSMIVTDVATFYTTLVGLEEAFIGAYMAAAQVFTYRKQPDLVRLAVQIGAVECDHRAHARFYAISAGVIDGVPNDLAYEKPLFTSVGEAAAALQSLGWIGGSGMELVYPGPGTIDNPGVTNLQP